MAFSTQRSDEINAKWEPQVHDYILLAAQLGFSAIHKGTTLFPGGVMTLCDSFLHANGTFLLLIGNILTGSVQQGRAEGLMGVQLLTFAKDAEKVVMIYTHAAPEKFHCDDWGSFNMLKPLVPQDFIGYPLKNQDGLKELFEQHCVKMEKFKDRLLHPDPFDPMESLYVWQESCIPAY